MKFLKFIAAIIFLTLTACERQAPPINAYQTHNQKIAQQHASLVFSNLSQGYTDRAQENLLLALHEAPKDPVILDTAGYYFEKTGDLRTANQFYLKAVKTAPTSGIVKNNYGAFLCRNGRYKASLPYFQAAAHIRDTPITREALSNYYFCYKKMHSRLGGSVT